jgi:hypothetical protein
MRWSVTASRVFLQCPKKWYYETVFASPKTTDTLRKEAYLLKQLQSVHSWRGKLVDQVISDFVIPKLNLHKLPDVNDALAYADRIFQEQLAFAKAQRYRNNNACRKKQNYCALFELEYGSLSQESLQIARDEIHNSLLNFFNSNVLSEFIKDGLRLIAQRTLQFPFANVTVYCTPDLIVFFKDKPPIIVDWKVEAPQYKEHWLQLGVYGVAFSHIKPHKDFPAYWWHILKDPTKITLLEFQLLRNRQIKYSLTEEDIVEIEDYIYKTSLRMQRILDGVKKKTELINLLPTAKSPQMCIKCKFRKICWKIEEKTYDSN